MSPIDKLRHGIEQQEWGLVCEAYMDLTGVDIEGPDMSPVDFAVEDVMCVIETALKKAFMSASEPEKKKKKTRKKTKKKTKKKKSPTSDDVGDEVDEDIKISSQKAKAKKNLHGTKKVLITGDDLSPTELRRKKEYNEELAAKAKKKKVSRPKQTTFRVECSDCGDKFDSPFPSRDIGQQCKQCLRGKVGDSKK